MRILTLNPRDTTVTASLVADGIGVGWTAWEIPGPIMPAWIVSDAAHRWADLDGVAVRFARGRARTVMLDDAALEVLERKMPCPELTRSLAIAREVRRALPHVPLVGCFGDAFPERLDLPFVRGTQEVLARSVTR
jgi:hypothetical protein